MVPAGRTSRRRRPRRGVGWPAETGSERPSRCLIDQDFSAPRIGNIPPAEAEARDYAALDQMPLAA
jgi:hypothetical protein